MRTVELIAHGAWAGLALFGATVIVLGGASLRLALAYWALGILVVLARRPFARRATRPSSTEGMP